MIKIVLLVLILACQQFFAYSYDTQAQSNETRDRIPSHDLIEGVKKGDIGLIQNSLNEGIDPNVIEDSRGWNLLMYASAYGHSEMVRLLVKYGAQLNVKDRFGNTLLILGSQSGSPEVVKVLLKLGPQDINARGNSGGTALMAACKKGQIETVRALLKSGAHVNIRDKDGNTALMFAAVEGDTQILKLLLESGADLSLKNNKGWDAVSFARITKNKEVISLLEKSPKRFVPFVICSIGLLFWPFFRFFDSQNRRRLALLKEIFKFQLLAIVLISSFLAFGYLRNLSLTLGPENFYIAFGILCIVLSLVILFMTRHHRKGKLTL